MSDEFPTLEVVLLASVAVLARRGFVLARVRRELEKALPRLLAAVSGGTGPLPPDGAAFGAALDPLARAAFSRDTTAPNRAVAERALGAVRRMKSAAARDLVICAVLSGSLVYAFFAGLEVSALFVVLGAAAALLLLLAVRDRLLLARALASAGTRLAEALGERGSEPPDAPRRCRRCRAALPAPLRPEELGARLLELGARDLTVCPRCGSIEGRAGPRGSAPEEKAW